MKKLNKKHSIVVTVTSQVKKWISRIPLLILLCDAFISLLLYKLDPAIGIPFPLTFLLIVIITIAAIYSCFYLYICKISKKE